MVSLAGGDATDDAAVAFLLSAALSKNKEEEEERRKREEELRVDERKLLESKDRKRAKVLKGWDEDALWQLNRRVQAGGTLSPAEYAACFPWDAGVSSSSSASGLKRKRKKKRRKESGRMTSWRGRVPGGRWRGVA